jgi:hypothetical protein
VEQRFDGWPLGFRVHATPEKSIFDLLITDVIFVKHWQKSIKPASHGVIYAERLQTTATGFHEERFVVKLRGCIAFAKDCQIPMFLAEKARKLDHRF